MSHALLQVENLCIFVRQESRLIPVVKNVNFAMGQGECLGIVGESGCGKSMTAQTIACLGNYHFEGNIKFNGENIQNKNEYGKRKILATQIAMIFQNPQSCLNPTIKIGEQIREVNPSLTQEDLFQLMRQVGLLDVERCYQSYPHQLSGGMCQRALIAIALARKPQLIIADEITTALDVTIQAQILDLIRDIQQSSQTSTLLITHDFNVVTRLCNRVLVMYAGEIVEEGSVEQVLQTPQHPYTKALLASRPRLGQGKNYPLEAIPGKPPKISTQVQGCPFLPRCKSPLQICAQKKAVLEPIVEAHKAACWQFDKRTS